MRLCCRRFLVPFYYFMLMTPRPSDAHFRVAICGVFQLGSTLGTREILTQQTIDIKDLSGPSHSKCRGDVPVPRN